MTRTPDSCATPGLRSVRDMQEALLAAARPVAGTETVPLAAAAGRVLAADLAARVDVPPADNSAMDGYAVRSVEAVAGGGLPVSARIAAGDVPGPLAPGTAARIFTGAPLPPGADTVVMQEDCEAGEGTVTFRHVPRAGANVRRRGEDLRAGAPAGRQGTVLGPLQLGVLAAAGHGEVAVVRRVRAGLLSTGNELLEPGEPPAPGRIYNSNRAVLRAMLAGDGAEPADAGRIGDSLAATREALRALAAHCDFIVTTGGASVGEEDHLRAALAAEGRVGLWKVAVKPGKPMLFGQVVRDGREVPVLGLPGNPVSAVVTWLLFGRPFLQALQGAAPRPPAVYRLPAGFSFQAGGREEYLRVRHEDGVLRLFPKQGSGVLSSLVEADGLARVPAGGRVDEGGLVDYLPLAGLVPGCG